MGASAGRVLLIPKGDWNANTTYTGLDWVRHNGAAWVCKNTCTNIKPTLENADNWQMMARDGDMVTADTAMSDSSTNAVQNKVIKSYVDDKFSFSNHDTATSGTSFTDAEDGNMLVTDWTKNLLNPTLQTTTQNGVTCTNNGDGTYTLNGTATSAINMVVCLLSDIEIGKLYKIIGCPTGGSLETNIGYKLYMVNNRQFPIDYGYGAIYKSVVNHDEVMIQVNAGTPLSNLTFKPMLTTDLSATYDDFVPYSGYEIKSCGKNLLNPTLQTTTQNGITCTNNGDGTYTLNGTATKRTVVSFNDSSSPLKITLWEKYKAIFYSDNISNVSVNITNTIETGYDGKLNGFDFVFGNENTTKTDVVIAIIIQKGVTFDNVIIKPMLTTDLSATYDDFEPYTGETITVTNTTEAPAFGLKSHKGITNIISPANVKCVYPTNESGKGVLDAMYNNSQLSNELSKLKNAIIAMGGTV